MTTDPNTLLAASRCFRCIPNGRIRSVIIYLLTQWANGGVVPPGCLVVYEPSTAPGTCISNGNPIDFNNLAEFQAIDPASITFLDLSEQEITSISGLQCLENLVTLTIYGNTIQDLDVSGMQFLTEISASDNNLTESAVDDVLCDLDATGLLGGTVNVSGTNSTPSATGMACATNLVAKGWTVVLKFHATVEDWNTRVIANGGTAPTFNILASLSVFCYGLDSSGLSGKMGAICTFTPGAASPAVNASDMIRAMTPLNAGTGSDPWFQTGFPIGNLTVDGLKGDGGAHHIETGITADSFFGVDNAGVTIYNTFLSETADNDCFAFNGVSQMLQLFPAFGNDVIFDCWDNNLGGGRLQTANTNDGVCYVSANRTAANAFAIYTATSAIAHSLRASGNTTGGSLPTADIRLLYSPKRFSFVAIHVGLTESESSTFFNLIQALRTAFGGGYV